MNLWSYGLADILIITSFPYFLVLMLEFLDFSQRMAGKWMIWTLSASKGLKL